MNPTVSNSSVRRVFRRLINNGVLMYGDSIVSPAGQSRAAATPRTSPATTPRLPSSLDDDRHDDPPHPSLVGTCSCLLRPPLSSACSPSCARDEHEGLSRERTVSTLTWHVTNNTNDAARSPGTNALLRNNHHRPAAIQHHAVVEPAPPPPPVPSAPAPLSGPPRAGGGRCGHQWWHWQWRYCERRRAHGPEPQAPPRSSRNFAFGSAAGDAGPEAAAGAATIGAQRRGDKATAAATLRRAEATVGAARPVRHRSPVDGGVGAPFEFRNSRHAPDAQPRVAE
jgi:hypothetical protein